MQSGLARADTASPPLWLLALLESVRPAICGFMALEILLAIGSVSLLALMLVMISLSAVLGRSICPSRELHPAEGQYQANSDCFRLEEGDPVLAGWSLVICLTKRRDWSMKGHLLAGQGCGNSHCLSPGEEVRNVGVLVSHCLPAV